MAASKIITASLTTLSHLIFWKCFQWESGQQIIRVKEMHRMWWVGTRCCADLGLLQSLHTVNHQQFINWVLFLFPSYYQYAKKELHKHVWWLKLNFIKSCILCLIFMSFSHIFTFELFMVQFSYDTPSAEVAVGIGRFFKVHCLRPKKENCLRQSTLR